MTIRDQRKKVFARAVADEVRRIEARVRAWRGCDHAREKIEKRRFADGFVRMVKVCQFCDAWTDRERIDDEIKARGAFVLDSGAILTSVPDVNSEKFRARFQAQREALDAGFE